MNAPIPTTPAGSFNAVMVVAATDHVEGIRVSYQPVPDPARLLLGRTPEEALSLVALLHGVCRHAHRLGAAAALGVPMSASVRWRMHCEANAEAMREALLHAGVRWHQLIELAPVPSSLLTAATRVCEAAARASAAEMIECAGLLQAELSRQLTTGGRAPAGEIRSALGGSSRQSVELQAALRRIDGLSEVALPMAASSPVQTPRASYLRSWENVVSRIEQLIALAEQPDRHVHDASVVGQGDFETCRGPLHHSATLDASGAVASYAIDAPSNRRFGNLDWMRPGLERLRGRAACAVEPVLGNWLAALDPCGGVSVSREPGHA